MAKLISLNRERLAVVFDEEFWSVKHSNSPSEAVEESNLRDKEVSFTENMLASACVGFGTENGEEVGGPSMWIGRGVSIWVKDEDNLLLHLSGGRIEGYFPLE